MATSLLTAAMLVVGVGVGGAVAWFLVSLATPPRWTATVQNPGALVRVHPIQNYASYTAIERNLRTLDVGVYRRVVSSVGRGQFAAPLRLECVSHTYLDVIGVRPFLGRSFDARDDVEGGPPLALLAYRFWSHRFGGDSAVLGQTMEFDGRQHTIIGVAPPLFGGVDREPADAWTLLSTSPTFCSGSGRPVLDQGAWLRAIGRVRRGFTFSHADQEIAALFADAALGRTVGRGVVEPLYGVRAAGWSPGWRLGKWVAAGAALMLLVVCANVFSVRALQVTSRRSALAVRRQLGATRWQLGVELFAESGMLTAACVPAAVIVATWIASTIDAFFPISFAETMLSTRGLGTIAAIACGVGGVSGVAPAINGARTAPQATAAGQPRGAAPRPIGGDLLLAAQVAAAVVLIMAALLFVRSTGSLRDGLDMDVDGVLVVATDLERAGFGSDDATATLSSMADRVAGLPQVEAVALASRTPMNPDEFDSRIGVLPPGRSGPVSASTINVVSPSYFDVIGTRLVHGRAFTPDDRRPVMIVSEELARRLWPGERAIHRCAFVQPGGCVDIVGVSESRRHRSVRYDDGEEFFVPLAHAARYGADAPRALLVRLREDSDEATAAVAAAVRSAAPDLPFVQVSRLRDMVAVEMRSWHLATTMFSVYGGIAIALAVVGVYGSLANAVRWRTPEIGVRMALGARRADIAQMTVRRVALVVVAGWAIGGAVIVVVAPLLRAWLFGIAPVDGVSFVSACGVVAAAAVLGAAVPVSRAVRVEPSTALRS